MKKTIRHLNDLVEHNYISQSEAVSLEKVATNFSFSITPHMLSQITDKTDPLGKQFIPDMQELLISDNEMSDPIGDTMHSQVKGIVHRYPDRCLLLPLEICPVYCRFCFRREKVGKSTETLSPDLLEQAFLYIESHPEIWEVIITGGDPLVLKPLVLTKILKRLQQMSHVEIIRIHTRVPVVMPDQISSEMLTALKQVKTLYLVIHANHPQEFTNEAKVAILNLVNAGIPLLSQTVLLKDINDNIETLSQLMRLFIQNKIKPYYLHHTDLAKGTSHFRTSIEKGLSLMRQLRGRFSGICQPLYVLDIPGGYGKTPLGPSYVCEEEGHYWVEDYKGKKHHYPK